MVHHVENVLKLIIGSLSAVLSNGNKFNQVTKPAFKRSVHAIEGRGDHDDDEILTISTIQVVAMKDMRSSRHDQPEKKRKINLQCKVYTGAQSNVLPIRLLRIISSANFDDKGNLKPEALEKNGAVLSAYGGFIIVVYASSVTHAQ